MGSQVLKNIAGFAASARAHLRRPELMVFLPAVTLAAFWLGGERALILTALSLPILFVMAGAFRFQDAPSDERDGMALRPRVIQALSAALADGSDGTRRVACLVVLFDEMERLVEMQGRAAQTEVLARCGERIASALRPTDVMAPLEGGGYAVALLGNRRLDLETVIQIGSRLQAAVSPPISLDATRIYITCSIGFCLGSRSPATGGQALLDAAQTAAEDALRNGPGALRAFAPEMARHRAERDALTGALEAALDSGEVCAYFQPQISTETGEVSGFEALARWHHPERGLLPPSEFLPRIEAAGLSGRLSEVMLYQALSALARWDKAGLQVPAVAINASLADLRDTTLPDRIRWELDRFNLTPERLGIEILETVIAATDNDVVLSNISALSRLGCGLDLDDFGTGHASITNIRRFSVRRIKIDRSFVARIDEDQDQQRMLAAILSMAEQLGIETLAEGVETQAVHAILAQLGCQHVQGFGIARPMPLEDTLTWIARHQGRQASLPRIGNRTN